MKQLIHALILRNMEENPTMSRAARLLDDFCAVEGLFGVLKNTNRTVDIKASRPDL
jgi:hypothetical protein